MARNNRRHVLPGDSQYIESATQLFPVPEFADSGDAFVPRTTINLRDYYTLYNNIVPEYEVGRWYWLWPWHWHWNWPWHWLWHWLLAWHWPWQLHASPEQLEILEPYHPEKPLDEPEDFLLYDYYDTDSDLEDSDKEDSDREDSDKDSAVEDLDEEESDDEDEVVAEEKEASQNYFPKERGELKSSTEEVQRRPRVEEEEKTKRCIQSFCDDHEYELGDFQSQEDHCINEEKKLPGAPKKRAWEEVEEEKRITKRLCDDREHVREGFHNRLAAGTEVEDHGDILQQEKNT